MWTPQTPSLRLRTLTLSGLLPVGCCCLHPRSLFLATLPRQTLFTLALMPALVPPFPLGTCPSVAHQHCGGLLLLGSGLGNLVISIRELPPHLLQQGLDPRLGKGSPFQAFPFLNALPQPQDALQSSLCIFIVTLLSELKSSLDSVSLV